ncbi:hypothetical protein [Haloarcula pelagica]|uniref:hypothetical protein n=1 Tax=Haloarcula pelagica TaxID=3033389 RepID=UPI0024C33ADE|nr:hypothetical protein [Halomicroarcula sp. YJ-61-S]
MHGTMGYHGFLTGNSDPLLLTLVFAGLSIALGGVLAVATYGLFVNGNWGRGLGGGGLVLLGILSIGWTLLTNDLLFVVEAVLNLLIAGYLFSSRSAIEDARPDIDDTENSQTVGLP